MHRSFRIPEIVHIVVSYIDPAFVAGANAQLAALARTSKIFHDDALNMLWRHQDTIANFVKCMPDDSWEEEIIRYQRTIRFRRPVVVSDWERPLHYAHRLRSLEISSRDAKLSTVYQVIRENYLDTFLLPNLQSLSWGGYMGNLDFNYINLFLGPRITSVYLDHIESDLHLSLLPTLTRRFPALAEASVLLDFHPDDEARSRVSSFVRGLQNVRSLTISHLDLASISHLGHLPTLRCLRLTEPLPASFSSLYDLGLFPNLPVCHFQVSLPTCPTTEISTNLYRALAHHCIPESLLALKVDAQYGTRDVAPDDAQALPGDTLQLLCCFRNLVEVSIEATVGYHLDDATIGELARAWPYIEELHLIAEWHEHPPTGTLLGLRAFAQHCPYLHTLELTFDASSVPESPAELHLRQKLVHPTLITLNVAHSPISSGFDVARYMSAMFPNLTDIETAKQDWNPDPDEDTEQDRTEMHYHELWKQVETFLPGLNDIRAEEYHWGLHTFDLTEYLPLQFGGA
ncbi:hypothetical protein B0H11DRAFT_1881713 [Mycena galericulata]|nr:hypothetical protein B0H11DRAFT_1881713 [Mycena galericulata]